MKKSVLAGITVLMLLLVACHTSTGSNGNTQETNYTGQVTTERRENSTERTDEHGSTVLSTTEGINSTSTTTISALPTYVSGSIELEDESYIQTLMDVDYPLHYRAVYYELDAVVENMANQEEMEVWYSEYQKTYSKKEPDEMFYVMFIKRFNIPRTDFEEFIKDREAVYLERGTDTSDEMYELPNPDIVYTFDNAIINEYYRRE